MQVKKEVNRAGWLIVGISLTYILIQAALWKYFAVMRDSGKNAELPYYMSLILGQAMIVIPALIYIVIDKGNCLKRIACGTITVANILKLIVLAYLISPVMTFINALSTLFVDNVVTDTLEQAVDTPIAILIILIGVIPAVMEEVVFRGILYHQFRMQHIGKAMLMSALLFGCIHMNFNQFFYATIVGFFFALLIEATGSILSSIVIHFVINTSNAVMGVVALKMLEYMEAAQKQLSEQLGEDAASTQAATEMLQSQEVTLEMQIGVVAFYGVLAIISGTLAFFLFRHIAKSCGRWEHVKAIFGKSEDTALNEQNTRETKQYGQIFNISTVCAILLCFGFMIYQVW